MTRTLKIFAALTVENKPRHEHDMIITFNHTLRIALFLGCAAAAHAQNLIVNGSFELPLLASGANHVVPASELLPWQTTEDAFLIWASELPNELAADGRQHAEIVSAWQTASTIPGEAYRLRFHHSPRPGVDSTLSVEINGQVLRTFTENAAALAGFNWQRFATNFMATSNATTVRFSGTGVAGNAHIDNVILERLPLALAIRVAEVEVCWETVTNKGYQVQYRSELTTNAWASLGAVRQGTGTGDCIRDSSPLGEPQRFYRVITDP